MRLLTASQSRQIDALSEKFGVSVSQLMQQAGSAVAQFIRSHAKPEDGTVWIFAGKGNNGGDARIAAELLQKENYSVLIIEENQNLQNIQTPPAQKISWIVDGLLGTGLKNDVRGWTRDAIAWINAAQKNVLSIDIPSGLSADTGNPLGIAVHASATLCLGDVKLGVMVFPGCEYAGEVHCADIGIPQKVYDEISTFAQTIEPSLFKTFFQKRLRGAHKKDFGHVLVIAGSEGMPGAGYLSSYAALRSGSGLVNYALPKNAYKKFDSHFPEVMLSPIEDEDCGFFTPASLKNILEICEKKNAVVIGPGIGRAEKTIHFICEFLEKINLPCVIDADALFALGKDPSLFSKKKGPMILTPHLGEMAFLTQQAKEEIEKNKIAVVMEFAKKFEVTAVLKGFRTLIATADGNLYVNTTGNPGMATAGSGDVLAGIIGGFLAQSFSAEAATLAGVYLHGLAGDLAAKELGEKGMVASDLCSFFPKAMQTL